MGNQGDVDRWIFGNVVHFHPLAQFTWFGWVGVEVFFVISGFVITNSARGASPIEFLKGRVLRLYPAAWICATLSLFALIFIAGDHLGFLPVVILIPCY
jgi:exopolysaccharide production protein ExoZ